jgi:hypothetical protein
VRTSIKLITLVCVIGMTAVSSAASARGGGSGGGGGHRSSSVGPGTGSNSSSHNVHGYVRKDGTYVEPHRQSNSDHNFNNNWSTKGNQNPYTGKEGTQAEPPTNH